MGKGALFNTTHVHTGDDSGGCCGIIVCVVCVLLVGGALAGGGAAAGSDEAAQNRQRNMQIENFEATVAAWEDRYQRVWEESTLFAGFTIKCAGDRDPEEVVLQGSEDRIAMTRIRPGSNGVNRDQPIEGADIPFQAFAYSAGSSRVPARLFEPQRDCWATVEWYDVSDAQSDAEPEAAFARARFPLTNGSGERLTAVCTTASAPTADNYRETTTTGSSASGCWLGSNAAGNPQLVDRQYASSGPDSGSQQLEITLRNAFDPYLSYLVSTGGEGFPPEYVEAPSPVGGDDDDSDDEGGRSTLSIVLLLLGPSVILCGCCVLGVWCFMRRKERKDAPARARQSFEMAPPFSAAATVTASPVNTISNQPVNNNQPVININTAAPAPQPPYYPQHSGPMHSGDWSKQGGGPPHAHYAPQHSGPMHSGDWSSQGGGPPPAHYAPQHSGPMHSGDWSNQGGGPQPAMGYYQGAPPGYPSP